MSLYTPAHFEAAGRAATARLMHDHPFATLVTPAVAEPFVSHLPLLFVPGCEPHGLLLGHMARANPHWRDAAGVESIAIFHGPHAYVSPSWYGEPAKAVPTWNYAVVHASGTLEIIADPVEARRILDALVHRFEAHRDPPWQLAMAERERDALVNAIVGFRMRIRRISTKLKLSQNRPETDQVRVAAALEREDHPDAGQIAAWMREYAAAGKLGDPP